MSDGRYRFDHFTPTGKWFGQYLLTPYSQTEEHLKPELLSSVFVRIPATGQVIYKGRAGGFGNLIKVRHRNGYITYYGHLSRFGPSIEVGARGDDHDRKSRDRRI